MHPQQMWYGNKKKNLIYSLHLDSFFCVMLKLEPLPLISVYPLEFIRSPSLKEHNFIVKVSLQY
jgi:hypothetical protein